jgi:hypothetical protein
MDQFMEGEDKMTARMISRTLMIPGMPGSSMVIRALQR